MSDTRYDIRIEWLRDTHRLLTTEAIRLRAAQMKLYEAPLEWSVCIGGVFIRLGAEGYNGGQYGIRVVHNDSQYRQLCDVLPTVTPLDRDSDRWGCGEDLGKISSALSFLPWCEEEYVALARSVTKCITGRQGFLDWASVGG